MKKKYCRSEMATHMANVQDMSTANTDDVDEQHAIDSVFNLMARLGSTDQQHSLLHSQGVDQALGLKTRLMRLTRIVGLVGG